MSAPLSQLSLVPAGGAFFLTLPLPISFNQYKDRRQFTTKKGRIWRDVTIQDIWNQCGRRKPKPLIGRCSLSFELWMPEDNRKRDADNYAGKHVIDCLVKAGLIEDDNTSHIAEYHVYHRGKAGKGWILVSLIEI